VSIPGAPTTTHFHQLMASALTIDTTTCATRLPGVACGGWHRGRDVWEAVNAFDWGAAAMNWQDSGDDKNNNNNEDKVYDDDDDDICNNDNENFSACMCPRCTSLLSSSVQKLSSTRMRLWRAPHSSGGEPLRPTWRGAGPAICELGRKKQVAAVVEAVSVDLVVVVVVVLVVVLVVAVVVVVGSGGEQWW